MNPYMLFTAYERTAYAELLAAAFIPLLLHAILRQRVTIPHIAIPVALLWLTNAPAAVMSCYALALLAIIRIVSRQLLPTQSSGLALPTSSLPTPGAPSLASEIWTTPGAPSSTRLLRLRWASREGATAPAHANPTAAPSQTPVRLALNAIAGTTLGLALAAFYLLPAAYERRYIQIAMAIIPNMRIQDNFLFHHTGDALHDQVLHTASLIAILLLALTLAAIVTSYLRPNSASNFSKETKDGLSKEQKSAEQKKDASSRPERSEVERPPHFIHIRKTLLASLAILTAAIALLLTPLTTILWNHAPELAFLQFPWRLLAILAAAMSLAVALAITRLNLKPTASTALTIALAAALTYPAYALFHQPCDEEDTPTAREALFHSNHGTDPTDEYTPTTADNDSLAQSDPAYWLSADPNAKAPTQTQPAPAPTPLTLNPPIPEDLILNLRDYPAWRITDNGSLITTRDQRDDGLIAIPIPAGPSLIAITYARTADQTLGNIISFLALATLLITLRRRDKV
ncbi:hypothetical protein RBB78_12245 [Tunturiibacter empetritectus]|uniref:hypothetical protein n=1 Tax=Tunturiibacter empetritectus TaxID=3069691 RepID=UPI003D9B2704